MHGITRRLTADVAGESAMGKLSSLNMRWHDVDREKAAARAAFIIYTLDFRPRPKAGWGKLRGDNKFR